MRELLDLDIRRSTGGNDGLDLSEQPLSRLLAISRRVVSVMKVGESRQSAAQVCLAQLGQESLDCAGLGDSSREAGKKLKLETGLIEVGDVDEVFMFLWRSVECFVKLSSGSLQPSKPTSPLR